MGSRAAGDRNTAREAGAAGSPPVDVGACDGLPAGDALSFCRRSDQPHLQELLGPAAPRGGDTVQWRSDIRAVVGPARKLRAQLLVLLRRRRDRILGLCARGADA